MRVGDFLQGKDLIHKGYIALVIKSLYDGPEGIQIPHGGTEEAEVLAV
ncbi:hypothetical protein ES703_101708 [subsurface metagenome]